MDTWAVKDQYQTNDGKENWILCWSILVNLDKTGAADIILAQKHRPFLSYKIY